jgi:glutamate formiminotransferase
MKVIQSDWLYEKEEEDQEELGKISNARSEQAFIRCKEIMLSEKHVPEGAQFIDKDYEAWALGGRTYLIRSHVNLTEEKGVVDRKYACKIKYNGGDIKDATHWESLGVDFNEPG